MVFVALSLAHRVHDEADVDGYGEDDDDDGRRPGDSYMQVLSLQEGYHKECLPGIGLSLIHTADNKRPAKMLCCFSRITSADSQILAC